MPRCPVEGTDHPCALQEARPLGSVRERRALTRGPSTLLGRRRAGGSSTRRTPPWHREPGSRGRSQGGQLTYRIVPGPSRSSARTPARSVRGGLRGSAFTGVPSGSEPRRAYPGVRMGGVGAMISALDASIRPARSQFRPRPAGSPTPSRGRTDVTPFRLCGARRARARRHARHRPARRSRDDSGAEGRNGRVHEGRNPGRTAPAAGRVRRHVRCQGPKLAGPGGAADGGHRNRRADRRSRATSDRAVHSEMWEGHSFPRSAFRSSSTLACAASLGLSAIARFAASIAPASSPLARRITARS